jgi:hypothetical protein
MLAKIKIFNVVFHAITIIVYAFFLRSTIERHTDICEIPYKPLLRCSMLAFFPSFILSAVLVGSGLWQVIPTVPSEPVSRHWLYDVGYLLFSYGSVYAITTWDLHRRFKSAIDALDVSFSKMMIFTAAKTSLSAPIVFIVSVVMIMPLLA